MEGSSPVLLFSYFKGHGDGLHLAWSTNGYQWSPLNNDKVFLQPGVGKEKLMRDPFITLGVDGAFHLVWTAGWHESGIGYATSNDLVHWPTQRLLKVMAHEKNCLNCWAPEIFYDETRHRYMIYWATTIPGHFPDTDHTGDDGLNHRMYYTTTVDFKTFTKPKLFFDVGFNVIDATVVKNGHRYVMFMKNETLHPCEKNIRFSMSEDLFSGFEKVSSPITGPYWAEGPAAVKVSGEWMVYFDKYKVNEMGAVRSADLQIWHDISDQLSFPEGAQHGSVLWVPFSKIASIL